MTITTTATGTAAARVATSPVTVRRWRTEDWIAVVLGFLVITTVLAVFQWKVADLRNVVPTFRWTTDSQIASMTPGWNDALDAISAEAQVKRQQNVIDLSKNLKDALAGKDRKAIEGTAAKMSALGSRTTAGALAAEIRGHAAATADSKVFTWDNLSKVLIVGAGFLVIVAIGSGLLGLRTGAFLLGLPVIFALAFAARLLAGNGLFINWGIEYVIFALLLGLTISNTIGTPEWLKPAVQTEFFIKTGLVILGASLLFYEVLQAGAIGLLQAVLVVFVVWYTCYWLCKKLRVDDEFAAMLSTAVSICGVSAAIAACGAIQGDKKKLSYVTSLVLIVAVPMMIVMPWIVKSTGMNDLVAGAWLGGTLDTSASVVAAGALISDAAMKTGVIVKFSQNALIGVAAFVLAIWWAFKQGAATGERPSASVIWDRFPKFVIGFVIASAIFSFWLSPELVNGTRSALNEIRTWWFALAFVCIGLETRFVELATTDQGRPALAFVAAQSFNVVWTLLLAWLLFGGVIFAQPVIN
ncbi:MAG TPA: putative sulfate exporter family transporter [Xanthobacteraceae bacterium]|nr:putative sulfate exporter family transporter [Xanthobacteraceae bacterium]